MIAGSGVTGGSRRIWRIGVGPAPRRRLGARIDRSDRWVAQAPAVAPVSVGGRIGHVVLRAESLSWLRRFLAEPAGVTPVSRLTLRVRGWRAPRPEWSGRLGPLPGVRRQRVVLPRRAGTALVEVELSTPMALHDLLTAALAVLTPIHPLPRPASADVIALGGTPRWLSPAANHVAGSGLVDNVEIRAYDIVLAADPSAVRTEPTLAGVVLAANSTGARSSDRAPLLLIDPMVANPIGRDGPYGPDAPSAELRLDGAGAESGWRLVTGGSGGAERVLARGTLAAGPLAADQLDKVRRIARIRCAALPGRAPDAEASLLVQFAATGAVLDLPELPPGIAGRLAAPLRSVLTSALPDPAADGLEWEIRSVRQRNAAVRGHAAAFGLGAVAAGTFAGLAAPPSVSAILVTRRPDYIRDAVRYIAAQSYPELEIVLCLHGIELDPAMRAELAGCGRPVEVFTAPAGLSFGEVMGGATARARGSLVTKFDDDDVYGPEHVWDLVLAREYSGAVLVGKAAEFVYLQMLGVTVRRRTLPPESYGPPVAGGTMLMGRGDLEAVGGWRPVPRSVDRGLMDRVLRAGGLIYRTHPLGYLYERRTEGHTWDAGLDYFLRRSGQQWDGFPRHREFGTAESVRLGVASPAVGGS